MKKKHNLTLIMQSIIIDGWKYIYIALGSLYTRSYIKRRLCLSALIKFTDYIRKFKEYP